ncbi:AMIN-like domain-containing (lipo)protein [Jiangella asiatica]|uniref:AMIN-like domain-containing protein n=1 Tax=Jiangella asiatica TaxID=2530372 RepID=A0A4R5DAD8_9ACTN|nr:hypothetical protein [Jiangella asiatica]TDE08930.1 hypothetical protein E1269_16025 [Jiangella asiatica]
MKRTFVILSGLLALIVGMMAVPGLAATAAGKAGPSCGLVWGSLPEQARATDTAALVGVRAGRHPCFDRLVLDFAGDADGYAVRYVPAVTMDGSGQPVALRGGAYLEVVAVAPAHDARGAATYRPANRRELVAVSGWQTFRQASWAGSFEGRTTIGLGVRARLPFRGFTLDGPGSGSRLVIDVAHRW